MTSAPLGGAGTSGAQATAGAGTFVVDEVRDGDVDAVVDLWRACGLTRPWNDPHRDLANARATPTSTVLVLRREVTARGSGAAVPSGPVGTVMAGFDGHRGWLYYLAVDASLRGGGLGRTLVVAAEAWLAAQGAEKVQLMVRTTNTDVQGFYARLGYSDAECVVLGRRLP